MKEYIGREVACKMCGAKEIDGCSEDCLMIRVPTADVAPVVQGEWKPFMEWFEDEGVEKQTCWVCSICGRVEVQKEPYCNCGARMDGGNSND